MAMNKAKCQALPPDLKKVIDANSGHEISGWLGKTQQAGDATGRKAASDRGKPIFAVSADEAQNFRRKSRAIEVKWIEGMDKRGFEGRKLVDGARSLIEQYGTSAGGKKARVTNCLAARRTPVVCQNRLGRSWS